MLWRLVANALLRSRSSALGHFLRAIATRATRTGAIGTKCGTASWVGIRGMGQGRDLEAAYGKLRVACETDRDASAKSGDPAAWPAVGVVIPTKDHADLLAECILGLEKTT